MLDETSRRFKQNGLGPPELIRYVWYTSQYVLYQYTFIQYVQVGNHDFDSLQYFLIVLSQQPTNVFDRRLSEAPDPLSSDRQNVLRALVLRKCGPPLLL